MKTIISVLIILIFASSASATVYKWVDERGVVNFTDDSENIPPAYRDRVEEVNIPRRETSALSQVPSLKAGTGAQTGRIGMQAPSISQTLVREGDFAITLAQALRLGAAAGEAEAESVLASAGIAPRNGWIADYPLTPDIIGELQNSIGEAADSGRLAMKKDEALKVFQDLTVRDDLPLRADNETRAAESEPPGDYGEYSNPTVINNYYYNEGPPVVTYYPPPVEYRYLYAWVPYPFWCSRFRFPGFFILHDFHKTVFVNRRSARITNHFIDPRTRRVFPIDPVTRKTGRGHPDSADGVRTKGFRGPDAERGASAILRQSQGRARPGNLRSPRDLNTPGREIPSQRSSNAPPSGRRMIVGQPTAAAERMTGSDAGTGVRSRGDASHEFRRDFGNAGRAPSAGQSAPARTEPDRGGSSRTFRGSDSGSGRSAGGNATGRR